MVGRTPADIVAIRPLRDGAISEFEITEAMLKYFIDKSHEQMIVPFPRPRVVVGVPSGVTEVEKRAVYDAARSAGAREAFLIEDGKIRRVEMIGPGTLYHMNSPWPGGLSGD